MDTSRTMPAVRRKRRVQRRLIPSLTSLSQASLDLARNSILSEYKVSLVYFVVLYTLFASEEDASFFRPRIYLFLLVLGCMSDAFSRILSYVFIF